MLCNSFMIVMYDITLISNPKFKIRKFEWKINEKYENK